MKISSEKKLMSDFKVMWAYFHTIFGLVFFYLMTLLIDDALIKSIAMIPVWIAATKLAFIMLATLVNHRNPIANSDFDAQHCMLLSGIVDIKYIMLATEKQFSESKKFIDNIDNGRIINHNKSGFGYEHLVNNEDLSIEEVHVSILSNLYYYKVGCKESIQKGVYTYFTAVKKQ